MDILSAAKAYEKLLDYEYNIVLVKNRNFQKISLNLSFPKYSFFHLCGLHKLTDIGELQLQRKRDKEKVFDDIISGKYPNSLFESSVYYHKIEGRIECLELLEAILDNNESDVFRFNSSQRRYTTIDFDFLIKNQNANKKLYYLVIENRKGQNKYLGCSCFRELRSNEDYAKGHTLYSVLQKLKKNLITHEETELYIAPSYKKQLDEEKKKCEVKNENFDDCEDEDEDDFEMEL